RQALQMIVGAIGLDHVDGLLAAREPLGHERQEDSVLLLLVVEEGADVPRVVHDGAGQGHRCR
ncbi:MAG: hypothetical protein AB7N90_02945, partial [Vicinamibacterales bacterium]